MCCAALLSQNGSVEYHEHKEVSSKNVWHLKTFLSLQIKSLSQQLVSGWKESARLSPNKRTTLLKKKEEHTKP